MNKWPAYRDMTLFLAGLAGVFHETVIGTADRPTLLILFAAMMGLPAFLRSDERNPPAPPQLPPQPPQQGRLPETGQDATNRGEGQ
jgi:hypothetical protein